jgi:hypothetical protein
VVANEPPDDLVARLLHAAGLAVSSKLTSSLEAFAAAAAAGTPLTLDEIQDQATEMAKAGAREMALRRPAPQDTPMTVRATGYPGRMPRPALPPAPPLPPGMFSAYDHPGVQVLSRYAVRSTPQGIFSHVEYAPNADGRVPPGAVPPARMAPAAADPVIPDSPGAALGLSPARRSQLRAGIIRTIILLFMVLIVVRFSLSATTLAADELAKLNEVCQNIGLMIGVLGAWLGWLALRKK